MQGLIGQVSQTASAADTTPAASALDETQEEDEAARQVAEILNSKKESEQKPKSKVQESTKIKEIDPVDRG